MQSCRRKLYNLLCSSRDSHLQALDLKYNTTTTKSRKETKILMWRDSWWHSYSLEASELPSANCLLSRTTCSDSCGWEDALTSTSKTSIKWDSFLIFILHMIAASPLQVTLQKPSDLRAFLSDYFDGRRWIGRKYNNCTKYNTQNTQIQLLLNVCCQIPWNGFSFEFKSKFINIDVS